MTYKFAALPLAALSLSACQTTANAPSQQPITADYKALGTEPFWSLTLAGKTMIFAGAGEKDIRVTEFEARPSFNGWRYTSPRITADVTFARCSDGMSDHVYKDRVTVMVDKAEYTGCGGGLVAPESLENSSWQIMSINGVSIPPERGAMVSFADSRMSGSIGCNRLGGPYTFKNDQLAIGPLMSTRMACPGIVGEQENSFTALLASPLSTSFPGNGTMQWTGANSATVILRQSL